jgi:hypothetical protein
MSSSGDGGRGRISRRRFLKCAGAFMAAGAIGTNPEYLAGLLRRLTVEENARIPADTGGAAASQVPADSFSIFWITDTQFLSESNPALFNQMTNWIVNNWGPYNGRMVIHTGDIVQTGAHQEEWVNADEAMSVLLSNGIPYCWCAGNHDDMVLDDPTSGWSGNLWSSAFNPSTVGDAVNQLDYACWVGDYHDGMNTAVSFTANGLNFLVVNVEWNAEPAVLEWVQTILDDPTYANHYVIVAPHAYINAFGSLNDPRWSEQLAGFIGGLTPILNEHSSNVFLTLNGHFATDCGYNTPAMIKNRNELMFDRQDSLDLPTSPTGRGVDESDSTTSDIEKVGGATVTILTFETVGNQISVKTYDTYADRWRNDPYEQYTIPMLFVPHGHGRVIPLVASVS